ncbi:MAG TPA: thioredoxin family protein [Solirubrobacteraceae bacterium]|nr:thioredoxin family protein [Solirubrobacteraceae bacterium]
MSTPIEHLTDDTYAEAAERPGILVIDFWAGWCGPCRAMAPQFERAATLRPQYRFAKVDVDAEPAIAARYAIRSIPTLMVLRDGEPIAAQAGVVGAEQLIDALDRLAAEPSAAQAATGATV